jgi:uncharacterized protein involved in exopolysaccharide biosynthesis
VDDDAFTLRASLVLLWKSKRLVILPMLVCGALGVLYSFTATKWYQAEVVLSYANQKNAQSPLSQLSGLAGLVGFNLPNSTDPEPLAVLRSKGFARRFIEGKGIERELIREDNALHIGSPDLRDAVAFFDRRIRAVVDDKKTGLVTVSVRWKDSTTASLWANDLVRQLNDELQSRAELEASRNLAFLKEELAQTSVLSLQQAIGRLVESEMQKEMLAKESREFAFHVIDAAVPPKKWDSPKRLAVSLVSALLGLLAGAGYVLMTDPRRWRRSSIP